MGNKVLAIAVIVGLLVAFTSPLAQAAVILYLGGVGAALFLGAAFGNAQAEWGYKRKVADALGKAELKKLCVEVKQDGRTWAAIFQTLPAHKVVSALRVAASPTHNFTSRDLSGTLTRSEYEQFRDELIARGFLQWTNAENKRLGTEWTSPGRALLAKVSPTSRSRVQAVSNAPVHTHAHSEHPSTQLLHVGNGNGNGNGRAV